MPKEGDCKVTTLKEMFTDLGVFVVMPSKFKFYNNGSVRETCDMAQGPCCCGAWHTLGEWPIGVSVEIAKERKL